MELSIIIPTLNEEKRIGRALEGLEELLGKKSEIIVVDDNSRDATREIAVGVGKRVGNVRFVRNKKRLGKGASIVKGMKLARGRVIAFIDADGAVPAGEVKRLVRLLEKEKLDLVIASRYAKGARVSVREPPHRVFLSRGFNFLVRLLFGIPFLDTQCGLKVMSRRLVNALKGGLREPGYAFDVELIWKALAGGFRVAEVPICWRHVKGSHMVLWRIVPKMFIALTRLRLGL